MSSSHLPAQSATNYPQKEINSIPILNKKVTRESPAVFRTEQLHQNLLVYLGNCWYNGKELTLFFKGHLAGIY